MDDRDDKDDRDDIERKIREALASGKIEKARRLAYGAYEPMVRRYAQGRLRNEDRANEVVGKWSVRLTELLADPGSAASTPPPTVAPFDWAITLEVWSLSYARRLILGMFKEAGWGGAPLVPFDEAMLIPYAADSDFELGEHAGHVRDSIEGVGRPDRPRHERTTYRRAIDALKAKPAHPFAGARADPWSPTDYGPNDAPGRQRRVKQLVHGGREALSEDDIDLLHFKLGCQLPYEHIALVFWPRLVEALGDDVEGPPDVDRRALIRAVNRLKQRHRRMAERLTEIDDALAEV